MTQTDLDRNLDRQHNINVEISSEYPLSQENHAYDPVRILPTSGFQITPRELLHAIGCKTAAIPSSQKDECVKNAWLFTNVLNLSSPHLSINDEKAKAFGSDNLQSRSKELGIGFLCLIAEKYFNVPWDRLEPIGGNERRFDYQGKSEQLNCIFEAKGTSNRIRQPNQIRDGYDKKTAHHERQEFFDVELIISTAIERNGRLPRIIIADPDFSSWKDRFLLTDDRYYRLRHYCRILQYIGLPETAYQLNKYAQAYLKNKRALSKAILDEKQDIGILEKLEIGGDEFLGRWFDFWLPKSSKKYEIFTTDENMTKIVSIIPKIRIFQGLRRDIFRSLNQTDPFSQPLIEKSGLTKYKKYQNVGASVFSDGTIMIIEEV
jgi:hypothetical protein